jgi:hypothetical protein
MKNNIKIININGIVELEIKDGKTIPVKTNNPKVTNIPIINFILYFLH